MKHVLAMAILLSLLSGCGRVEPPTKGRFGSGVAASSTFKTTNSPIPKQPWFEIGPEKAPVRILAFFPMDEERKPVMDLLKGLAKQYPGKVYVKFMDVRSPEGQGAMARTGVQGPGLLFNGQGAVTIDAKPAPYRVDLNQDMGRYWTADDLKAAVAQELAKHK